MALPRTVTIEVFDEEYVALRGTAQVHWFIRVNDGWVHVAKHSSVREERLDPAPGTVYRTRFELDVAQGTRLMRVESKPFRPKQATTVEHLLGAKVATPRQTSRRIFAVDRRGMLVALRSGA